MKTGKQKKPVIRKRNIVDNQRRPYIARVRMTSRVSKSLASIQGLCRAFGNKESLADLIEKVALPAIEKYVEPYADKAKKARLEKKA